MGSPIPSQLDRLRHRATLSVVTGTQGVTGAWIELRLPGGGSCRTGSPLAEARYLGH
jgi:hypothetical protein